VIISASYKTDIPAFYGVWFMNRLAAGSCRMVNPYGRQIVEVKLTAEAVDGFVFWTRNASPFVAALDEVRARGFPFVVQYTATGYPRALESSVIEAARAVTQIRALADRFGPRAAVWRYDPIVISSLTPADWHVENFAGLARALKGASDEVVISFAHVYRKTRRNLDAAAGRHGFTWTDPPDQDKQALALRMAAIAADAGMGLTICAQPAALTSGVAPARCIDAVRLSDVAGRAIQAPERGNRPGCLCAAARDIGDYDTCPHGCAYCYAVRSPELARKRFRAHEPGSSLLSSIT
jgi:hypothetical protein